MSYEIVFRVDAEKEWRKLDPSIRQQFAKKLRERAEHPHNPAAKLHGLEGCYKIKLRQTGYRLVYEVDDGKIIIIVVSIGHRDKNQAYQKAKARQG
ncbi:mRNA interferase RelE/StbE [Chromobacterium alkanivorans]|uniref:type II toxin-antitoxin system RelE family toxin n=1 Tax=Chromobacterium alkanivorans TaxID=1071719 RepID=UPI0021698512|nr:type II toxin-antitoxin system RelE/ParE family toxin [Chromobacterium alkanivorans]MCS3802539.1 mRNA interferase RelE/StbE [Chromobacterium alkanivorans]MCS3816865.1 mRNA interferase RelE/StbE [Chromobacterium alkanivorans]MCS3871905.1 mRNA interferase RelE/StbE [Chromobacterium alkanivorans]